MTVMMGLPPAQIRPSTTNPRKTFTELDELDELGASLLAKGMIGPPADGQARHCTWCERVVAGKSRDLSEAATPTGDAAELNVALDEAVKELGGP